MEILYCASVHKTNLKIYSLPKSTYIKKCAILQLKKVNRYIKREDDHDLFFYS